MFRIIEGIVLSAFVLLFLYAAYQIGDNNPMFKNGLVILKTRQVAE